MPFAAPGSHLYPLTCDPFLHLQSHQHSIFKSLTLISASRPGSQPSPPAVEAQSLNHWTAREVPTWSLILPFLPPFSFKDPCDYMGSTWITQKHLPISGSLTESHLQNPFCRVNSHILRFQRLGCGPLCGLLFHLPQPVTLEMALGPSVCSACVRWEQRGPGQEEPDSASSPHLPVGRSHGHSIIPPPLRPLAPPFTSPGDLEAAVRILSYYLSFPQCSRLPDKGDGI